MHHFQLFNLVKDKTNKINLFKQLVFRSLPLTAPLVTIFKITQRFFKKFGLLSMQYDNN